MIFTMECTSRLGIELTMIKKNDTCFTIMNKSDLRKREEFYGKIVRYNGRTKKVTIEPKNGSKWKFKKENQFCYQIALQHVGVEFMQTVDMTMENSTIFKNDIGFYAHEGKSGSSATTSRARDCNFWNNRTQAIRLENANQIIIEGGVLSRNFGKYTIYIHDDGHTNCTTLRDLWLEANAQGFTPDRNNSTWNDTRDIYVFLDRPNLNRIEDHRIHMYNVHTQSGTHLNKKISKAYAAVPVELAGFQQITTLINCHIGRGPLAISPLIIGEKCRQTLLIGCSLFTNIIDNGTDTKLFNCDIPER